MICPKCQKENPNDSVFCNQCGASFAAPVRRHRPIVPGIVGLVLSSSGIFIAIFPVIFAVFCCVFSSNAAFDDSVGLIICFMYTMIFGIIGLGLNIAGLILGKKARDRFDAEPNQHMGRGMYTAAYVLGTIGCILCAAAIITAVCAAVF